MYHDENNENEYDSLLPDLDDTKASQSKSFLPDLDDTKASQIYSFNISKMNTSVSNDPIKKLFEASAKYKILQENIDNACKMDKIIQKDGFNFNSKGQLNSFEESTESVLDENQYLFLQKVGGGLDPLIPIDPNFLSIFQLNSCNIKCYQYSVQSLVKSEADFLFFDQTKFKEFFNQIQTEAEQTKVLDCLFLNIPWLSTSCQMLTTIEILTNLLLDSTLDESLTWRITGKLIFDYLKSFGANIEMFFKTFPRMSELNNSIFKESENLSTTGVIVDVNTLEIFLGKLEELICLSLLNKYSLYTETELDLIFMLMVWLALDQDHASFSIQNLTQLVFNKLVEVYEKKELWSKEKTQLISSCIYNMIRMEIDDLKSTDLSIREKKKITNNLYHRIVHLIGYFKVSRNLNLKQFAAELALHCANDLLEIPNKNSTDVPFFHKLDSLTDQLKETCNHLFESSSYSMFNLMEFLDCILSSFLILLKEDVELKIKIVEDFKAAVSEANRFNKDHHDYKGRAQVKVLIHNFFNKCSYYLNKLGNRTNFGNSNFMTSQSFFNSIDNETSRSQFSLADESSIEMSLDSNLESLG